MPLISDEIKKNIAKAISLFSKKKKEIFTIAFSLVKINDKNHA